MATENNREIQQLKTQMAELLKWKKEREAKQLKLPLDYTSERILNESFRTVTFHTMNITNSNITTGNSIDPSKEGQIVYHENGGTPLLKIYIGGAVKTFTVT